MMKHDGLVIWITGLSGAGKSTLARQVVEQLKKQGSCIVLLDGDVLREVFGATTNREENHGREARLALGKRYSSLSRVLSAQGHNVIVPTISLFRELHEWNRQNIPNYFEVYLKVPIDELRRRDPKGLYRKFDNGELKNLAGLDLEIEEPENPDWVVDFNPERAASSIASELVDRAKIEDAI